ncbi:vicilin-like seed storage protein At2g18540 [Scyliorhinus canicula]|uniref:vicilin-like seed storage protein At2g18540 n=2 Tax=Scyliorhinus canicula TaxID=7830 RepID=UPI0018F41B93|nr:vicilin-like seed storage protein At2g18540 [Scyliorhinus canicula]
MQMPVQLQEKAKLEDPNVVPPPYSEEQGSTGLYPVISGTMNFEGAFDTKPMTMEDWERRELEKKKGVEEETRKTEEELDELSQKRKQLQDEVDVIDLLEWAKKGMEKEKEREEEGENDRRKDEGQTSPDSCEGEREASQGKIEGKRVKASRKERERRRSIEETCGKRRKEAERREKGEAEMEASPS